MPGSLKSTHLVKERLEAHLALVPLIRQVNALLCWPATLPGMRRFRPFCREVKWLEKRIHRVYRCPNYLMQQILTEVIGRYSLRVAGVSCPLCFREKV